MEHFSALAGVFVRQKRNFFAERNFLLAAKTQISCRKEIFGSVENGEKRGFGRLFPSKWRPSACKTPLSFCNPFPPWADAGAASVRTAFRSGRQSVAETAFRLSFRISGNSQDSHISVRSRPCVRPRDSRETGSDVLTKWRAVEPAQECTMLSKMGRAPLTKHSTAMTIKIRPMRRIITLLPVSPMNFTSCPAQRNRQ